MPPAILEAVLGNLVVATGLMTVAATARRLGRPAVAHADGVHAIAPAPDGSAVFSAGDRAAKWWPLRPPTPAPPREGLP